ncbi:MAG: Gfo/Idh/MocA family protein [Promethearchaeota archaeon]
MSGEHEGGHPIDLVIIGAGDRGTTYATYAATHPDRARVVGVAEPREFYRDRIAVEHEVPDENVFKDWRDLRGKEKFADAVIVATQDSMHVEPTVLFAKQGYHILLEKPMAPDVNGCREIIKAVLDNKILFSVGHVLRYTNYTRTLKGLVDSGAIGDVVSIQRLEPVGYWHQAHSFVRGNWRREDESSFMLLSKSCHDLDWIRYIVGRPCRAVSSFGSLTHFRSENRPENAGTRCVDCGFEPECPYSAIKIYNGFLESGNTGWPTRIVTPEPSRKSVLEALRDGPYGRCVYDCDNDVVDHQVVNMEFEGGITAAFTMTAFTEAGRRRTSIFGTRGEIYGNGSKIHVHDFLTDSTRVIDTETESPLDLEEHGGGDYWLMDAFVSAVAQNDPTLILSGPEETLESHLMVFAAEKSRLEKRVVSRNEF